MAGITPRLSFASFLSHFCPSSRHPDVSLFPQIIGRVVDMHERICN